MKYLIFMLLIVVFKFTECLSNNLDTKSQMEYLCKLADLKVEYLGNPYNRDIIRKEVLETVSKMNKYSLPKYIRDFVQEVQNENLKR